MLLSMLDVIVRLVYFDNIEKKKENIFMYKKLSVFNMQKWLRRQKIRQPKT